MKQSVFDEADPIVNGYVSALWQRIVEEKRLDIGTQRLVAHVVALPGVWIQQVEYRDLATDELGGPVQFALVVGVGREVPHDGAGPGLNYRADGPSV